MAKKKGEKQAEAADEVRAFDALDLKNQGQMLDSLHEELKGRKAIKTEVKDQLNVSKQLQSLASDILAKQDAQILGLRKENDIAKDVEKTNRLIQKLKRQANDDSIKGNKIAKDQLDIALKLKKALAEEEKEREKIAKKVGVLGTLAKGVAEIPIIGKMADAEGAITKMNDAAANGATKFEIMGKGIGHMATKIKTGMTDPFTIMLAAIKMGFAFDSQVTALGKGLGISREQAKGMRDEFSNMSTELGEMAITSRDMEAGFNMVNSALGTASTVIRADIVTEAGRMQKLMGMSEEAIAGFAGHAMRSGKDMKAIKIEAIGAMMAVESESGIRLNHKKILEQVGKTQGQISAQMGGDPARIAGAISKAEELGMTLEGVAAAGKQMLNFSSSIEAELEAELLIGKQLNLEKARLAALTGDYETLTEEINKNVGDFGDFTKLNVLQQEALAKSVGMTADGLSDQLMKKANLKTLAQEARDEGNEDLARQYEQRDATEQMSDIVNQLKESFVDMAGGPIGDFVKGLATGLGYIGEFFMFAKKIGKAFGDWINPITGLINKLGFVGKMLKGIAWIAIIVAAYKSYASLATIPIIGVPLGLAASIGILAAGNAALSKKADDATFEGGGYGKRALMEKGSVTLFNDNDTIVAGTDLGLKTANDATFTPAGSNKINETNEGGGGGQPLSVNVQATQQNDVFARTDKNSEDVYMVQTKMDGLFA
tara:strand:- start:2847 stop:4991 length:2145 start_codon:yes stop_codon:yes gene_type:complete